MTALKKLVLYSVNGVSTPTQWAALEALSTPQSVLDLRREEYRERRDLLISGLRAAGLECETPGGAFYAFPDVRNLSKDSRKVSSMLLEKAHVATIPGVVFGAQGEGHIRFGYAMPKDAITAGLKELTEYLCHSPRKAG